MDNDKKNEDEENTEQSNESDFGGKKLSSEREVQRVGLNHFSGEECQEALNEVEEDLKSRIRLKRIWNTERTRERSMFSTPILYMRGVKQQYSRLTACDTKAFCFVRTAL